MPLKLVCIHPYRENRFGGVDFQRGQEVTDSEQVKALQEDRDHHFVRVAVPDEQPEAAAKKK